MLLIVLYILIFLLLIYSVCSDLVTLIVDGVWVCWWFVGG